MDLNFWHSRWRNNEIGFHQHDFNRHLLKHWPLLAAQPGSRVFVPLCGKSQDMIWLAERGHSVVGCEIDEIAVKAFFEEAGLTPRCVVDGPVQRWSAQSIEILLGDFFSLNREMIGPFDTVYDRASLIAFPVSMRPRYAQALTSLTTPGNSTLLMALEYPEHEMDGPPFSVREAEIRDLFGSVAEIELLDTVADASQDFPRFRELGLSQITEKIYRLRRV